MAKMSPTDMALHLAEARLLSATGEGRQVRLAARLSIGETAGATNNTTASVSRWENAKRKPTGEGGVRWGQFIRSLKRRGFAAETEAVAQ